MTIEKAAELVSKLTGSDKVELFCHFEELLNPFDPQSEESGDWCCMFAEMCGYGIARNVSVE